MLSRKSSRCGAKTLLPVLVSVALFHAAAPVEAVVVTGFVSDSSGTTLAHIKYQVYQSILGPDQVVAEGFTDARGNYSFNITGPDPVTVYLFVEWKFALFPLPFYRPHVMILKERDEDNTPIDPGTDATFSSKQSPEVTINPAAGGSPVLNLTMDQAQANLELLRAAVNTSLEFYRNNRGAASPWVFNYDIPVEVKTGTATSFFHSIFEDINIAEVDITGAVVGGLTGYVSDIYHEMGHLVQYRFNGNSLPGTTFNLPSHSDDSEKSENFAMLEGWPSYVAELTDAGTATPDRKYAAYRDIASTRWLGDEASPTGLDGDDFESGEEVEGAVAGVWFGLHSDPVFAAPGKPQFQHNFRTMLEHKPDNIFEFATGFVADEGGPGTAGTLALYRHLQNHGIVYSRARFQSEPFAEQLPPNTGPPSAGNVREIERPNGKRFLFARGKIDAKFEAVDEDDLGTDNHVDIKDVKVGYQTYSSLLSDDPGSFTMFTPSVMFSAGKISLDTATFGGDADYELLVVGKNTDGFTDDFKPTWIFDRNTKVDEDEKYLRTLGAWYDKDRDHSTLPDEDDKVVVDNTPPTVDANSFKPR